jgi:deoxyribodipyrimidine photo-lyase
MKNYKRSLHIFRRDLRIEDNTALNTALKHSEQVYTCFIFNDQQINPHPYRSANGLAFMIESLEELSKAVQSAGGELIVLHGQPSQKIEELIKTLQIDAVFLNKDYTPFSRTRDKEIQERCGALAVDYHEYSDALLVEPTEFGKDDGKPYTVYTPFFKKASKLTVPKPSLPSTTKLAKAPKQLARISPRDLWPNDQSPQRISHGGRSNALQILERISDFSRYEEQRNLPALKGTTLLAPHNKFGTISIREVYHSIASRLGTSHTLIRELYWRDFFTHIAWHFPHVFGRSFQRQFDKLKWRQSDQLFEKWCRAETGFPIVDAGMRELTQTGFMHNRVRMIVASFLVKDLHIDWRRGERFFAQYLTDYDPSVNNGSWQWAASTGCDAQPYFRIFNPWLQQKKFDPDCIYIKKWIPELKQLSNKYIHTLYEPDMTRSIDYPNPIVEHSTQKIYAEEMFRDCVKGKGG